MAIERIVLLTKDCLATRAFIRPLVEILGSRLIHVFLSERAPPSLRAGLIDTWRGIRRWGFRYGIYQERAWGKKAQVEELLSKAGIEYTVLKKRVGSKAGAIASMKPDLILSCIFDQLVPKRVLDIPAHAVNIHPSMLPDYRGPDPVFWAVKDNAPLGLTAHYMTQRFDEGDILLQHAAAVPEGSVLATLHALLEGVPSLVQELVTRLDDGTVPRTRQTGGSYQKHATRRDVRSALRNGVKLYRIGEFHRLMERSPLTSAAA